MIFDRFTDLQVIFVHLIFWEPWGNNIFWGKYIFWENIFFGKIYFLGNIISHGNVEIFGKYTFFGKINYFWEILEGRRIRKEGGFGRKGDLREESRIWKKT